MSYKVVVTVPEADADKLRQAIGNAGGGKVGNYIHCSFSVKGTGRFLPTEGANPAIGEVGKPKEVAEERIEISCDDNTVKAVVAAIRTVHPYEEPANLTPEQCTELLDRADKALVNTYPESNSGYAVALLTKAGNIYEGVSYKSDTYTLTMHSEATALANAAIHAEKDIVAITGPNCHICKQLIYESSLNSGIDTLIIIKEADGIKQIPISELMPYPWPEKGKAK